MKIGVDVADVERFYEVGDNFIKRVYTEDEIKYLQEFNSQAERLAGFFCAKEAFLKALNRDIGGLSLKEIEVLHNENGEPKIKLYGEVKKKFNELPEKEILVSISHSQKTAIAMVLLN